MTNKDYSFDSTNLLVFLLKWKKPLIFVVLIAAISSAAVSLIIKEKFKSSVVMFPASSSSLSKALIAEDHSGKHDIMAFGEEEHAEQLLQILNSDEIRDKILWKYDLLNHYEIDSTEKYRMTKFIKEYEDNITFKRTEFQSVRIDVMDTDPYFAANIANDIAALVDSVKNRMQRERAVKALNIVEKKYFEMRHFIQDMEDSMTVLRGLGVHEYEVQIEMYTKQYSEALAKGNTTATKALEEKLNILAKYGSAYVSLRNNIEYETEKMTELRAKYEEAKVDATQSIPHKFIVNRAFPAEKKTYPIRWLIVVISSLSAFLIGVIAIIIVENYQKYNQASKA